jgi:integrase
MDKAKIAAEIARLEAQLAADETGVYEDPATGRWYVKFRVGGKQTTRRSAPSGAPLLTRDDALQARGQWTALLERDEVAVGRVNFEDYWPTYLRHAKAEMSHGSWVDWRAHGTKRLLPYFTGKPLSAIDVRLVREWRAFMLEAVEAGEWAPKTINNARIALLGCLNMAVADRLLVHNPVKEVKPLRIDFVERPFLRLDQIMGYVEAAPAFYRPLALFLIGTGARISEAIALELSDVDLHTGQVRIHRQRGRDETLDTVPTKGRAFRTVAMGPALVEALKDMLALRSELGIASEWLFLSPPPRKGRYAGRIAPPHRRTVHIWHQQALTDAGVRALPLHGLRHTAAGAWLATGRSLEFVRAQLGHSSVKVTSDYYGHLEEHFRFEGAADTEARIRAARQLEAVVS